jgi:hypothetical protein
VLDSASFVAECIVEQLEAEAAEAAPVAAAGALL